MLGAVITRDLVTHFPLLKGKSIFYCVNVERKVRNFYIFICFCILKLVYHTSKVFDFKDRFNVLGSKVAIVPI